MKRREFLKLLGAVVALPGMLAAVPKPKNNWVHASIKLSDGRYICAWVRPKTYRNQFTNEQAEAELLGKTG